MNIIACIKSVRTELVNTEALVGDNYSINPFDLYAFQSVFDLKSKIDCNITCLSMGANGIRDSLVKCYALGADNVIWLKDSNFAGSDTVATAYILSNAIKKLTKFDLITCGEMAIDGETGQVPAGLAEKLHIRYVPGVKKIVEISERSVLLETSCEKYENIIRVELPAVLGFSEFTIAYKNFSLMALKKAQRMSINTYTSFELDIDPSLCGKRGSKTEVLCTKSNFEKKAGVRISGNAYEAARLIKELVIGKGGG